MPALQTFRNISHYTFHSNGRKAISRLSEKSKNPDIRLAFYKNAATNSRIESVDFAVFLESFVQNYRMERSRLVRRTMLDMYRGQIGFDHEISVRPNAGRPAKIGWSGVAGLQPKHFGMLRDLLENCWRTTQLVADDLKEVEFPLMQAALYTIAAAPNGFACGLYDRIVARITRIMKFADGDYIFGLHRDAIQIAKHHPYMVSGNYLLLNIAVLNLEKETLPNEMQRELDRMSKVSDWRIPPDTTHARTRTERYNKLLYLAYSDAALALYEALPKDPLSEQCNKIRRAAFMAVPEGNFLKLKDTARSRFRETDIATHLICVDNAVSKFQSTRQVAALPVPGFLSRRNGAALT